MRKKSIGRAIESLLVVEMINRASTQVIASCGKSNGASTRVIARYRENVYTELQTTYEANDDDFLCGLSRSTWKR